MSLTPPPPPPPPHNLRSAVGASGCKTPRLASLSSRNLTGLPTPGSGPSSSPNQFRQILADITKQVNNSPESRSSLTSSLRSSFQIRRSLTSYSLLSSNSNNNHNHHSSGIGPITRSRSMVISITPRMTPRPSRSNTPMTNENVDFNFTTDSPTYYRRNFLNQGDDLDSLHRLTPLSASSSRIFDSENPGSPLTSSDNRPRVTPMRLRALSSVSNTSSLRTETNSVTTAAEPLTPASSSSSSNPNLSLDNSLLSRARSVAEQPPSMITLRSSIRERRAFEAMEQPSTQSGTKKRRRTTTGLGRL
ncbi:expressed protein [Phakopsora pachyrhizi]|uniref:Expressed protein n=1 Tax=Phakopsora pachyrhizi TaxID=170000 RepID=A0AAV0BGV8_PHAPC|nr:expressed protein [Phakopsora pachyrhizi]